MPDLPRVTAILESVGLSPDLSGIAPAILERAGDRGRRLHEAAEAHTYGYLDLGALDGEEKGYFAGYERFLVEMGYKPIAAEVKVVSRRWGVLGHTDGVGWLGAERIIPDWKFVATFDPYYVSYQLAGYRMLWNEMYPKEPVERLIGVQFFPDGTYRIHPVPRDAAEALKLEVKGPTMAEATQVFQAAVIVYKARERRV
ncbi:MAG TPA: hypothetical protein DCQ64_01500 [Candidatus Rokubacteria bacterium]|nr:hypothetical protein [Candidatus Rokubacteria bacterium]